MDVLERLRQLLDDRGWSMYQLAKFSQLSESTIANIFRRNAVPSIATLEAICRGFGITMAQFFTDGDTAELNPELQELFLLWRSLTPEQKEAALTVMRAFRHDR